MSLSWFLSPQPKQTARPRPKGIHDPSKEAQRRRSFCLNHTQRVRLEQERSIQLEKKNRLLYDKIRKVVLKKRSKSENRSVQIGKRPHSKMLLTFMKGSELPELPPTSRSRAKSSLDDILEQRSKYVHGYFAQIEAVRDSLRNKVGQKLPTVTVGKWTVHGAIFQQCVVLRGVTAERQLTKKYPYNRVAVKVREHYIQWVHDKFDFQQ